jgi:hypothetical protein
MHTILTTSSLSTDPSISDDMLTHYHRTTKGPIIENHITSRPGIEEIERAKILQDSREIALILCPSIRPKIKKFELSGSPTNDIVIGPVLVSACSGSI